MSPPATAVVGNDDSHHEPASGIFVIDCREAGWRKYDLKKKSIQYIFLVLVDTDE